MKMHKDIPGHTVVVAKLLPRDHESARGGSAIACFVIREGQSTLRSTPPFTRDRAEFFLKQTAGPIRSPYELDGFVEAPVRRFACHCCGDSFDSALPADPQRDFGYGTCRRCRDGVAKSWAKHGFCPEIDDLPTFDERLAAGLARLDTFA